jgi:hypothetical protein
MPDNAPTAHRLAYESRVTSYSAGRTAWAEVRVLSAGGFSVTLGDQWYDRNGERDYSWEVETFATRAAAFAAAGIADPLIETVQAVAS